MRSRGRVYTGPFLEILASSGVTPVRLPPRSPNLNAYAERFVRSIKEECLSRVVVLGERHLTPHRSGVHRALPRREEPPGARQPVGGTGASTGEPWCRGPSAGTHRRTTELLPSRRRMTAGPIICTLRGVCSRKRPGTGPGTRVLQGHRGRGHRVLVVPGLELVVVHRQATDGAGLASQLYRRFTTPPDVNDQQFQELMRRIVAADPGVQPVNDSRRSARSASKR